MNPILLACPAGPLTPLPPISTNYWNAVKFVPGQTTIPAHFRLSNITNVYISFLLKICVHVCVWGWWCMRTLVHHGENMEVRENFGISPHFI